MSFIVGEWGCSAFFRDHIWFLAVYYIDCSEATDHPDVCVCVCGHVLRFIGVLLHYGHVIYPSGWCVVSVVHPEASNSFSVTVVLNLVAPLKSNYLDRQEKRSYQSGQPLQLLLRVHGPQLHLVEPYTPLCISFSHVSSIIFLFVLGGTFHLQE